MLIVQKYGGTSVGDAARVRAAAGRIAEAYLLGHDVVAVLSAQGDTTDELLSLAAELNPSPPKRELDMLLATGEQRSVALMAICLARMPTRRTAPPASAAWIHPVSGGSWGGGAWCSSRAFRARTTRTT